MPLKWLIQEIIKVTNCTEPRQIRLHSTVYEDNQSAYFLATNQQVMSRTRYLQTRYHWFWSHVGTEFQLLKCPTDQMSADYLTKPLTKELFERNRERVQGW